MAYKDKAEQAAAAKRHYELNKATVKARAIEFKAKRRSELAEYVRSVKTKPCLDCGKSYPHYVMEFDHVSGEKFLAISNMVNGTYTKEKIDLEIAKCELVCANCHRERTFSRLRTIAG